MFLEIGISEHVNLSNLSLSIYIYVYMYYTIYRVGYSLGDKFIANRLDGVRDNERWIVNVDDIQNEYNGSKLQRMLIGMKCSLFVLSHGDVFVIWGAPQGPPGTTDIAPMRPK